MARSSHAACHAFFTVRRAGSDAQLSPWFAHRNHLHPVVHRAQDATGVRAVDGLKLTPHGLRHSGLTYLGASGASALNLQLHGRHASIQMTDKYLHMTSVEALRHLADMHDRAG